MLMRVGPVTADLWATIRRRPAARIILDEVARRARIRPGVDPISGGELEVGEAFLGDWEDMGLTRGQARQALKLLVRLGEITTRTTSRGTIAKLISPRIYNINPVASSPQTASQQPLTNTGKNVDNENIDNTTTGQKEVGGETADGGLLDAEHAEYIDLYVRQLEERGGIQTTPEQLRDSLQRKAEKGELDISALSALRQWWQSREIGVQVPGHSPASRGVEGGKLFELQRAEQQTEEMKKFALHAGEMS